MVVVVGGWVGGLPLWGGMAGRCRQGSWPSAAPRRGWQHEAGGPKWPPDDLPHTPLLPPLAPAPPQAHPRLAQQLDQLVLAAVGVLELIH